MPNQRREGWRVSTFSAPADLIYRAATKARAEGTTLSAVIRGALERFLTSADVRE